MKRFGRTNEKRVALLAVALCTLLAQEAHATAISIVSAEAEWTTFSPTLNGNPIDFAYGKASISYGKAEYVDNTSVGLSDYQTGWGVSDAIETIPNAEGHGYTSEGSINADGTAIADGITNTYGRGATYAYRIGYFSDLLPEDPTSTHALVASLTFSLEHFFDYNVLTEKVGGYNEIRLGFGYVDDQGISWLINSAWNDFKHYGFPGSTWCNGGEDCNGTWTFDQTLELNETIAGGRIYFVDASVYTDATAGTPAAVPEPTTLGLVGAGLIGFAVSRRRKLAREA